MDAAPARQSREQRWAVGSARGSESEREESEREESERRGCGLWDVSCLLSPSRASSRTHTSISTHTHTRAHTPYVHTLKRPGR